MLIPSIYIIVGFALLVWGADRFISGASATARNFGVSPIIIGLTIVGFGTSAPEMVVSAVASLKGNSGIALGNAIGSNIANISLVLGIAALIMPLEVSSATLKREYPALIIITFGTLFLLLDNLLGRVDGFILMFSLIMLTLWMAWLGVKKGSTDPLETEFAAEIPSDMSNTKAISWLAIGMIILPASSQLLVTGASDIARIFEVSDTVIGLTIIAIGTSLPELAVVVSSVIKKEHELAIGNVIGSNMFNILGVLGIAGMLQPLAVPNLILIRDYAVMLVLTLLLIAMSYGFKGPGKISRLSGLILVTSYLVYMVTIFLTTTSSIQ